MKIEIIGMSFCPQSYFHIEWLTKLEPVIPLFSWYGLHPLLPTKYLLSSRPNDNKDPQPISLNWSTI
jgi:hypothetical protein